MNTKIILPFLLLLVSTIGCNSVEPPPDGNGQDTTSHNFAFQSWTFGEHSSSVLYDVAIINENSIYAVGEIYLNDSLGQSDPNTYNAVQWDGNEWKLKRIMTNACGGVVYPPIRAVFAFSSNDILFAHIDGSISHFNGTEFINDCSLITQLNGSANKICGRSKDDFYVISGNGFLARYQNGSWIKIISGTDLDFYDIWGDYNSTSGADEIIAVAAKQFVTYDKKIFRINGNTVQNIQTDSIPYSIHGLWFKSGKKYFVSGAGLYSKNNINSASEWEWLHPGVTNYYLYAIRGQNTNDLFACGAFGELIHYNGNTWKSFKVKTSISNGAFNKIDFNQNIVVAVGYDSPKAVITMGTR
jgi:hypothetical protein